MVKGASLQELLNLHRAAPQRPGRGRKAADGTAKAAKATKPKKLKNYPKCAYPKCNKNRFVRGKGFCGEHWRAWKEGRIKSAEEYLKPKSGAPKKVVKKRSPKKRAAKKSAGK